MHKTGRACILPEQPRKKRIQEDEWNKYFVPLKNESEKCKASQTLSYLKNRITCTRHKCKAKYKDIKEKTKPNRHNFTNETFLGVIPCTVCEKPLQGKECLHCSCCNMIVHKSCKECASVCNKKSQESNHSKKKPQAGVTSSLPGDISQMMPSSLHPSSSLPIGLSSGKNEASQQSCFLSKSVPSTSFDRRATQFSEQDSEPISLKSKSLSEEMLQAGETFPSMDAFMMEDVVDLSQWTDLCTDAEEYEAESWSLFVDPVFCSKQEKDVVKRQDVIFELMQTEVHHIYTLFIMSEVFRKGMKEELQLNHSTVGRIFPCLDELLETHKHFFCRMKERRQESCEAGSEHNFVISRIGDILVQQFSDLNATKMKKIYGTFCSHHKEALSLFKYLQQNKKFQNFIKLRNSNLLTRRREIPECILLVTQRITKYPVLVERILQYSKEGTEEHNDLSKALCLIKDVIAAVDVTVNEYEKKQKLFEILWRTENRTYTKLKNGQVFRKEDLIRKERTLLHEGLVYWKTATGRFKDTLALLLTDVLLFLQEKDQKYVFAAVDQKPSVISLQRLIVREVANEERGMFLISASSSGPEMYEIHASSKKERNNWMRHIQDAVERCPEEEIKKIESDEDRRIAEAKGYRIQKYQESLKKQDQQICNFLEEKLRIYAELADMCGFGDVRVEPHLLIKPDSAETPQVASLLAAALREVENLSVAIRTSQVSETDRSPEENTEELSVKHRFTANEILESDLGDAEMKEDEESSEINSSAAKEIAGANLENKGESMNFPGSTGTETVQTIQNLTRLLYSTQAALAIQNSHHELLKLHLQENEKTGQGHGSWLNLVSRQEKYQNLEKQGVEQANIDKLKQEFQQKQQWWLHECDWWQQEQEERKSQLRQRERECRCQEELLEKSRQELVLQRQEYQQNLERLQERQKMVKRETNIMQMQKTLLWHLKHGGLSSFAESHEVKGQPHAQVDELCGENAFCFNEAVICTSLRSLNRSASLVYADGMYGPNISNSDVPRTSESQVDLNEHTSGQPSLAAALWKSSDPYQQMSFSCESNKDPCNNDLNTSQTQGPQTSIPNQGSIQSPQVDALLLNSQPESLQDTQSEDKVKDKIVYL
ncbi:PREDICTED: LOW QUALITY PROTEIN: rho guanine nucleotide exchange factor 28 [Acanthisitta chloris]|uniref:LOW QUALITY PROTEIN: rho guanine nucleotide exchange factor 28 n=1 Tax=Acanthisitta chloris TaxID=57068 RepID=UPI0004F0EA63|nr:PREDICTED: LOW QUALITY PROTEIN: rho guanine nucleotide exchange factor 28 [Acanthisitta chloris]